MFQAIDAIKETGRLADSLFSAFLTFKLTYYFLSGEDMLGAIFTVALGVWSISCQGGFFIDKHKKGN